MEKSLEAIWKEGFLKNNELVVPKINNLYNQKSQNAVDKLMKIGKLNLQAIGVSAVIILIITIVAGLPYMGDITFYIAFMGCFLRQKKS